MEGIWGWISKREMKAFVCQFFSSSPYLPLSN